MRVSYSQLKRYLPGLNLTPTELADLFTHQGLVVEALIPGEELFSPDCLAGTLVETVQEGEYTRCTLQSKARVYEIMIEHWGIPPLGSRVLINPVGSGIHVLPLKNVTPVHQAPFLITLPPELPDDRLFPFEGIETVIECEVTANRGDCLSLLGLIREISAGADLDIVHPEVDFPQAGERADYTVENQDALDLCPFYSGRVVRSVTVRPSPWWVMVDLLCLGIRPVNNVVDYTNLAMMEFGQPLHAFDASTLVGNSVLVRRSGRGETIVTLDGVGRKLAAGMLVIADRQRAVAVAGIMGGRDTEVTPATRDIVLEAAIFDGVSVRRTSRALGMRTEASSRFERGVDPQSVLPASSRVLFLLQQEETRPEVLSPWLIAGELPVNQQEITFHPEYAGEIMAFSVDRARTRHVLSRLGFRVEDPGNGAFQVTVPSWRSDIQEPIDLAEEVGRVVGYRNIDAVLPELAFDPGNREVGWLVKRKLRSLLVDRGLYEVVTISLINRETARMAGIQEANLVIVNNPLVHEQNVLRPMLLLSSLESLRTNISRGRHPVGIFEIGDVFLRHAGPKRQYAEESRLFVALNGSLFPPLWQDEHTELLFDLKGLAESILDRLGIAQRVIRVESGDDHTGVLERTRSFCWYRGEDREPIGWGGLLREELVSGSGFWGSVYCLELRMAELSDLVHDQAVSLSDISRFPPVRRDVSVLCPLDLSWQTINQQVRQAAEVETMNLESIEPFDSYQGKSLPPNLKSLSFTMIFRSSDRTLTDQEIDQWVIQVKHALKGLESVILREDYTGM